METISSTMEQDHVLIDGIAAQAVNAAQAGDRDELARHGAEFLRRLRLHIEVEEQVLFPVFEQRTGMVATGPSKVMRMEHEQMRPILARMDAAVAAHDGPGYERASKALFDILLPHNMKEERMMYPMLDEAAGDEVPALVSQARAMLS